MKRTSSDTIYTLNGICFVGLFFNSRDRAYKLSCSVLYEYIYCLMANQRTYGREPIVLTFDYFASSSGLSRQIGEHWLPPSILPPCCSLLLRRYHINLATVARHVVAHAIDDGDAARLLTSQTPLARRLD